MVQVMTEQKTNSSGFEKHFQTFLLTIITTGVIAAFSKLNEVNERLVRQEEKEKIKTEQINAIQNSTIKMQQDIDGIKERLTIIEARNPTP
jgi:uncharacterized membrane protein YhiD involved in acid resistance